MLNTNLRGVFLAMKYEIPYMLRNGGGNIAVTSSSNAIATTERRPAYAASKRGLVGLVQSSALDYASKGIRINALIPGTTDTELVRRAAGMEHVPDAAWEVMAEKWSKSRVPGQNGYTRRDRSLRAGARFRRTPIHDRRTDGNRWGEDRPCRLNLTLRMLKNRDDRGCL